MQAPAGTAAAGVPRGGGRQGILEWATRLTYAAAGLYLGVVAGVLWALAHAPLDALNGALPAVTGRGCARRAQGKGRNAAQATD
jgi:hypothetical protein